MVHWRSAQAIGVQGRAAASFRSPSTPMFVYCMWPWPPARLLILSLQVSLPTCTEIGLLCSVSLILTPSRSELHAAGCRECRCVNLSLFLELMNRARVYSKSWVHFAPFMGCRGMYCSAMHSCHVDHVHVDISFRHTLWEHVQHM